MKIFISYKQSGVDNQELTNNLWKISRFLKDLWHETFIYYFDAEFSEKSPKQIIEIARDEIIKSDLVLSFIHHDQKSEWMLLELWIAYGNNIPIITLMNTQNEDDYYLTYGISDQTILYDSFEEINNLLTDYFSKNYA